MREHVKMLATFYSQSASRENEKRKTVADKHDFTEKKTLHDKDYQGQH